MPLVYNPMLPFNFEEKDDIRIFLKDDQGNDIDITDYVAALNAKLGDKVNKFQGATNANKVVVTDPSGNITVVDGVVMNINERNKLASLTNPLLLKGVLNTYEELYQVQSPQVGWCYLVRFAGENDNIYKEYAYTAEDKWELFGNFNASIIPQYLSGVAVEIDGNLNVNLKYNPDVFEVDAQNRLKLKDLSYVAKCKTLAEINGLSVGDIFHWQGANDENIAVVDADGSTLSYIKFGYFYKKNDDTIQRLDKESKQEVTSYDINVSTWEEFLAAVKISQDVAVRIHFTTNITASSDETLDLSNTTIYGHYREWIVADNQVTLVGNFASFNNILFRGATTYHSEELVSLPLFTIVGKSSTSCNYIFDNCRFHKFLELGDSILLNINSASNSTIHVILHSCTITGESSSTHNRTLQFNNGGSGYGLQLKVMQLITTAPNVESNKIEIIGDENVADAYYSDGSTEYVGSYKPSRFCQWGDVHNATLLIQRNGVDIESFTSNDDRNKIANINVPEKTSDLTDDGVYLPLAGGKVSGTLILSRTQDASGTANNKPALIVGGTDTQAHIEIDANEIIAKASGTTGSKLWLQDGNGDIGFKGTDYTVENPDKFRAAIGAGTSNLALGTSGTTAAAGNHTHTLSIATDSGTNQLTLAASTKYKITAGGKTFIFTTPSSGAPSVTRGSSSLGSGGYVVAKYGKICTLRLAAGISGTYTLPSDIPKPDSTLVSVTNGQHIKVTQTQIIITSGYSDGESISYICQ